MRAAIIFIALIGVSLAANCLQCMCNKESGCKPSGCKMDKGSLSCGYFQINQLYYQECKTPGKKDGESIETAWKRCADDYDCSVKCVRKYVLKYSDMCMHRMDICDKTSRLHNGGPTGCSNMGATQAYWDAIKPCYLN